MSAGPGAKRFFFVTTCTGAPYGGSEALWSQTALALRERGHAVELMVPSWSPVPPHVARLVDAGAKAHTYRRSRFFSAGGVQLRLAARLGRSAWPVPAGTDLAVISQGGHYDGFLWAEHCASREIPFVTIMSAAAESIWPDDRTCDSLLASLPRARRNFFVADANRALLERQLGIELPLGELVRTPVSFRPKAALPWPGEGRLRLASVARLVPAAKGQDILLEALARPHWRERNLEISIFGEGPNARSLARHVTRLGLGDRVFFRGQVDDVGAIWREHHALVLPSRIEGLPLALVEAMLSGRPAIATAVAGIPELVTDGETGFLAAYPSADRFDDALDRAWAARTGWKRMGDEAREAALAIVPADPARRFADRLESLAGG